MSSSRPGPLLLRQCLALSLTLGLAACDGDPTPDTNDAGTTPDSAADVVTADVATDTGSTEPDADPDGDGADATPDAADADPPGPEGLVELRPLQTSDDLRFVDDLGRDVLLRGVNITSLGEYWQGDPEQPPTMPTTAADWDAMASLGVSVIRLVVHWSRIEPERGRIDTAYLDEVDAYVQEAAARGIYTVIDMHQDAYTAFLFTSPDEVCPEGTAPARGWDGAPAWAVFHDDLSTCVSGDRNSSPAVQRAWNHFYDNTEGIRDHFAAAWGAVALRFAGRPEVAGFDLLNEPEVPRPASELGPLYQELLLDSIAAIRAAEAEAGAAFEHIVFVEPAIPAGNTSFGVVVPDTFPLGDLARNLASAPHNYAESIPIPGVNTTLEDMNRLYLTLARGMGVPTWIGEYGFWSDDPNTLERLGRYAADEDRQLLGGAWWQWRQPCGDPHSQGNREPHTEVHLHQLGCPGDIDLGPTESFQRVFGRGYARATPGRLRLLVSDPATGDLRIEAEASAAGGELLVWTPTTATTHGITTAGLGEVEETVIAGGRLLRAPVLAAGAYSLVVEPTP